MQRAGRGEAGDSDGGAPDGREPVDDGDAATGDFDWRGWALVGAIVVAFLVVPAAILYLPTARGAIESLGLTVRDAYLVLPLLPAFGLGALAVWSAIHSRSE